MKTFLIATSLKSTWPKTNTKPVLFLGEWCKKYSEKENWKNLNSKTLKYHWENRKKLKKDYEKSLKIYELAIKKITPILNKYHKINGSKRFWKIIIGPWLGHFIQITLDRWQSVSKLRSKKEKFLFITHKYKNSYKATNTFSDFSKANISDEWNQMMYTEIINFKKKQNINQNIIHKTKAFLHSHQNTLGYKLLTNAATLINLFCNKNKFFIYISCMPFWNEIKLNLKVNYFFWKNPAVTPPEFKNKRIKLQLKLGKTLFLKFLSKTIPLYLPKIYLEGFKSALAFIKDLHWPNSPRSIFTSNAHVFDDIFKIWTAQKIDRGTKLFIGQHGGSYGIAKYGFNEMHDLEICDKYLSWGWNIKKIKNKIIPVGNFKNCPKKIMYNRTGKCLIFGLSLPRYSSNLYSIPLSSNQWNIYLKQQIYFLNLLPKKIFNFTFYRPSISDYENYQQRQLQDSIPDLKFNNPNLNIEKELKKCRVCIATYNSTTFLETLFYNIPTIIFWNPKFWEIRKDAIPFFDLLQKVGIFHKNPKSAALKLTQIWENVDLWWQSKQVQKVKEKFCEKFSKKNLNAINNIASSLAY